MIRIRFCGSRPFDSQPFAGSPGTRPVYADAEPGASGMRWSAMHLVTILLPLNRNDGSPQPKALFERLRTELVDAFGGATFFARAPADGLWEEAGKVERDEVVTVEVLVEKLDRDWWSGLRARLEAAFEQDEVLIRASAIERL